MQPYAKRSESSVIAKYAQSLPSKKAIWASDSYGETIYFTPADKQIQERTVIRFFNISFNIFVVLNLCKILEDLFGCESYSFIKQMQFLVGTKK